MSFHTAWRLACRPEAPCSPSWAHALDCRANLRIHDRCSIGRVERAGVSAETAARAGPRRSRPPRRPARREPGSSQSLRNRFGRERHCPPAHLARAFGTHRHVNRKHMRQKPRPTACGASCLPRNTIEPPSARTAIAVQCLVSSTSQKLAPSRFCAIGVLARYRHSLSTVAIAAVAIDHPPRPRGCRSPSPRKHAHRRAVDRPPPSEARTHELPHYNK